LLVYFDLPVLDHGHADAESGLEFVLNTLRDEVVDEFEI
jgi:hypothetical protein